MEPNGTERDADADEKERLLCTAFIHKFGSALTCALADATTIYLLHRIRSDPNRCDSETSATIRFECALFDSLFSFPQGNNTKQ